MELLLWRWSTTAQIVSSLTIAIFFVVLTRSVKRVELRPWLHAWLCNLGALAVTVIFWYARPDTPLAFGLTRFGYMLSKTTFVFLLGAGAWQLSERTIRRSQWLIVAFCAVAAVIIGTLDGLGSTQSAVMALVLGAAVFHRRPGSGWLVAGFSLRALLAVSETLAHASRMFPNPWREAKVIDLFLATYSSFDTAAEWVIALGCVLVVYRTIQQELVQSNAGLVAAQSVLQELVDRDPLTGLFNRRALPGVLRKCFDSGATILFFDLNDFKAINDSYGHQAGDEALKRFARALEGSFRPDDHLFRYSGDEFVVVAPGSEPENVLPRLDQVRERLRFERGNGPAIHFSAGHAQLAIHGQAEEALRMADEAMYREKLARGKRARV